MSDSFTTKMGNRYIRCVPIALILSNKVLHVRFSLSKLHLAHTLLRVSMQENLALEHGSEVFTDMLEELLDGGGVAKKITAILMPRGGISHCPEGTLLGIRSMKYVEFLF